MVIFVDKEVVLREEMTAAKLMVVVVLMAAPVV